MNCGDVDPIFFTDDNSGSATGAYSNQNHTITLCPDAPGQALSLAFLVFSLERDAAADNDVCTSMTETTPPHRWRHGRRQLACECDHQPLMSILRAASPLNLWSTAGPFAQPGLRRK